MSRFLHAATFAAVAVALNFAGQLTATPFGESVGVDAALSWISRPSRLDCPESYSNDTYRYVADLIADCGVRHVRERLRWRDVAPSADVWKPGRYLTNADLLRERGIAVSGMFHDAAEYALPKPKLPRDLVATYKFCKHLAETFGDRMEIWEFWNEEDIGFTREGAWDFAAAFKAASLGFRAGGFRGVVAPGALCREDRGDYERALYRNGVADFADIMNFHLYCPPTLYAAKLEELRRFMDEFGIGDRSIFLTECGTNQEGDATEEGGRKGLKRHSPLQEAVQEEFAVKSQIISRMEGAARNYFFVFGAFNERNGEKDWGALRRDGSPKPVVAALRKMLLEIGEGTLAGEVETSDAAMRAFRFDMPGGKKKLVYWRRTELDNGGDTVRAWDDKEVATSVRLDDGTAFPLRARRRPQFAPLPQEASVLVKTPPRPVGRIGAVMPPDIDPAIILRVDFDAKTYALGGNKSVLELKGDSIGFTLEVWNLDETPKTARIAFDGRGAVEGLPDGEIVLPSMGKAAFRLRYGMAGEADPLISFSCRSGGRRASAFEVPVFSEAKYLAECEVLECAVDDKSRWSLNSSADSSECAWDETEGAMRFSFRWNAGDSDRWLFPGYSLNLPREALSGARLIAFRVKSRQDKVENDWKSARVIFRNADGEMKQFMHSPPNHGWETKYLEIADAVRAMGAKDVGIGGHPKGRQVDLWIKDIRIFRDKSTTTEDKQ